MGQPRPLFRLFLVLSNKQYNFCNKSMWKKCHVHPVNGSPGLVVMGDNSCFRGRGFKSRWIHKLMPHMHSKLTFNIHYSQCDRFGKIWATFSWSGHTDYIYHFTWSSSSQPCLKICPYGLRGFVCVYPSADPRFESEAHHLSFFQFVLLKFDWQKVENKPKRGWNWALILNVYQREAKKENGQIFLQASQVGRIRMRIGHFKRFHHRGARCEKGPISVCSTSRLQRS